MTITDDERKRLDLQLDRLQRLREELEIKPFTVGLSEREKGHLHAVEWRIGYLISVRDHDSDPLYPDDFAEGSELRRYWFEPDYKG